MAQDAWDFVDIKVPKDLDLTQPIIDPPQVPLPPELEEGEHE